MITLAYTPTEKLSVNRPVNRVRYIVNACINKNVLDLGCFDETALVKEDTGNHLFTEISKVSSLHIGVDNSALLPPDGLIFSDTAKILRGNIYELDILNINRFDFDIIIAGELIEHLPNTIDFFAALKKQFPGKRLICSTPNATAFSNMVLSLFKRESAHIDHLQVYSFKTLNTLCKLAKFTKWQIIPYHVKFTEMILQSGSVKKQMVAASETIINGIEKLFPMTAGGYIIEVII
ncbi:MAG: class I SAM-dependent methyltransferase [Mucilaginibacter sp.]